MPILPLTCSSYLGQTGDPGRKTRTQQREGIPSDVSPGELDCCGRAVSGNHLAASAEVSLSVAAAQVRAQPGHGRAPRGGSAGTRRRRLGFGLRPDPGRDPYSRCPGGCGTGRLPGALGRDARTSPRSQNDPGGCLGACGTAPGAPRLSAPLSARPLRPGAAPRAQPAVPQNRQTPDTTARSLDSAAGPASPAAATQGAAGPAGRRYLLSIGRKSLSVTLRNGLPRRRGPAPQPH